MYNQILADLQSLSDECDKILSPLKNGISKVHENCSCIFETSSPLPKVEVLKKYERSSEVQELFDLFNQIEREFFPPKESWQQFPHKLANVSEKRTIDILTGARSSTVYQGPIFSVDSIHRPAKVPYIFEGKNCTYEPDFQIGNLVIEVKCYGAFTGGFAKNKKLARKSKGFRENMAKFTEISKTKPFQVWIFESDQGDLIDIITYVDGQAYHSNGHPFTLFKNLGFLKTWLATAKPLPAAKTLQEYFLKHTISVNI